MATFTSAIDDRYFEDYEAGETYEFGTAEVTEESIVSFAREFDPQPFHIDRDAAVHGPFGGIIASGWHTCALMMRMYADHYLSQVASLGGPGVDELRWSAPVRPGDKLAVRATVEKARPSRSKPDRGLVHTRVEVLNQGGDVVMSAVILNFLRMRNAAD